MKKICFFDIDGTLLDHDKKLPSSTKEAIESLKENGVYVAIATGRAPFMFEELRKELAIDSYVSFNGQFVVYEKEVIFKNPLSKKALHKLYEQADIKNHPLVFMNEHEVRGTVDYSQHVEETLRAFQLAHPKRDERFFEENDIYQTLFYCTDEEEAHFQNISEEIRYIRWHPVCVDVVPANGSKANGILQFIEKAGFKMENVYAFGDGLNDIEMLSMVGTGIAMGNAEKELFKRADVITTSVDDDGIYNGLRKVNLI